MSGLPIDAVIPDLIAALRAKNMAVLQAPPGAGKTTRVPLELLKAKLFMGKIIMLEPRRLAARAAAERLAEQLGERVGKTVGYAMRGANTTNPTTKIDVVTEGILTRMIQSDPELSGISALIFDEFHERNLQADLGLALALEIREGLREDLCILPMSATLDAEPVAALLGDAPIITSQGRSYPVEARFLDKPWRQAGQRFPRFEQALADLISQASSDETGSILAFLPGEGEIRRTLSLLDGHGIDADLRPLFGAMPFAEQRRAIAPSERRKIVLATSIAETSLTIEGIRIVVDGGLSRRAAFDAGAGMGRLETLRVTKAEATQRAGRAGRLEAGIAYKLWTKGEDGGLAPFPPPEILSSDLTSLVLDLARWGARRPDAVQFLTQPRQTDFKAAQELLNQLGAITQDGAITDQGMRMAKMPTHPRIACLLSHTKGNDALLLAALLEARDPIEARNSDLAFRMEALKDPRKFTATRPYKLRQGATARIKADAIRLTARGNETLSLGQVAALAYPDRVGLRRTGSQPRFLLSGGAGAYLDDDDTLARARMIVATDLDGDKKEARIRLAAPITEAELRTLYPDRIVEMMQCRWSKRDRAVRPKIETRFMALVLAEQNWQDCPPEELANALLEGVSDLGLGALNWTKEAKFLRARVEFLRAQDDAFPDYSDEGLMNSARDWLLPFLFGLKTAQALKTVNLRSALWAALNWEDQQRLDAQAPAKITAPTGTGLAIDYSGAQPKIAVRLQELFGLATHPVVGPKRLPLLIELLSPAGRPVQTTADLPNFWRTSYADVRKDMRGRYPRHPWPENPLEAEATRRAKPRGS